MIIEIKDDFDLDRIADSGQCFRWKKQEGLTIREQDSESREQDPESREQDPESREQDPESREQNSESQEQDPESREQDPDRCAYRIIAGKFCLYIASLGNGCYELDCTSEDYDHFWQHYFDMGESYKYIRSRIDSREDPFLWRAAEHEKGIRILRQDPWEMLITFIISQNRNIPAIWRSVELLAEACGERRVDSRGQEYYAFPEPKAILELTEKDLTECKLGYRWKYVHAAAESILRKETELNLLQGADAEPYAMEKLTALYGVGKKVASCVSLFGLHHTDAFPVDVWMNRILKEQYPNGYPYDRYSPYNGIYQQYMFAYYRHRMNEQ